MINPSQIGEAYGLTGDRNTELAVIGIARVCAADGNKWRPVVAHEVSVWGMAPVGRVPWSAGDAVPDDGSTLRILGLLVKANLASWVEINGALGIEISQCGHVLLDFHYGGS